ncbi:MAG: hypothetical protein VR77_00035 [Flavobacteriales bacterium BRH_c54]|nr:MAG: hypothetical protein VR77_00035 [Flavobacteriales bacterium BRH_c54]
MYFNVVSIKEIFILEVLRNFKFLLRNGYSEPTVSISSLEANVSYSSKHRKISITMPDPDLIIIEIHNRSFTLKKNQINVNDLILDSHPEIEIPGLLNDKNVGTILKQYSNFISKNLSAVIKGEEWT